VSNQRKAKNRSTRRLAPSDAPAGFSDEPGGAPRQPGLRSMVRTALGGLVAVALASGLAFGVHEYVKRTPLFAATELNVSGVRRLSQEEVLALAQLKLGQNILALDTTRAEEDLLKNPWIRSATITRRLPGSLRIQIEERQARAKGLIEGQMFLISEEGEPFKVAAPGESQDLPIISGIDASRWARDPGAEIQRLLSSIELLDEYEHSPLGAELPAEELHWDAAGQVILTVGRVGTTLHLGLPPFRAKLARAERVIFDARAEGTVPAVIFLDNEAHPERVVVRVQ
jgi:cell division protein FtsQ